MAQEREAIGDDELRQMMRDSRPSFIERYLPNAVTLILIVINIVVYIVEFVMSDFSFEISTGTLLTMGAMYAPLIQTPLDLLRLVTPMFLHLDLLHLAFNMVALFSVGMTLERVLGHGNFLLLYLIGGITGNAICYASSVFLGQVAVSAGASTGLFGLFVGVVMLCVLAKGDRHVFSTYSRSMLWIIIINIVYTLIVPGISLAGHLGGALGGLIGMFMIPSGRLRVPNFVRIIVVVLWVVLLVLLFASQGVFGL